MAWLPPYGRRHLIRVPPEKKRKKLMFNTYAQLMYFVTYLSKVKFVAAATVSVKDLQLLASGRTWYGLEVMLGDGVVRVEILLLAS
jgi:hypothetical protein